MWQGYSGTSPQWQWTIWILLLHCCCCCLVGQRQKVSCHDTDCPRRIPHAKIGVLEYRVPLGVWENTECENLFFVPSQSVVSIGVPYDEFECTMAAADYCPVVVLVVDVEVRTKWVASFLCVRFHNIQEDFLFFPRVIWNRREHHPGMMGMMVVMMVAAVMSVVLDSARQ